MAAGGGHWIKEPFYNEGWYSFMPKGFKPLGGMGTNYALGAFTTEYNPQTDKHELSYKGQKIASHDTELESLADMAALKATGSSNPATLASHSVNLSSFEKQVLEASEPAGGYHSVTQVYSAFMNHLKQFGTYYQKNVKKLDKESQAAANKPLIGGLFED